MADKKISLEELKDFTINKKFIMVDSRAYYKDAFEYILFLADKVGSIVFVYDTKKIYANGRYFGGDIFEADLIYFSELVAESSKYGSSSLSAIKAKDTLILTGEDYLEIRAISENDENKLVFKYHLDDAIDKSVFKFNTNAEYNLSFKNNKLSINEYIPLSISISNQKYAEFDSNNLTDIEFNIELNGTNVSDVFNPEIGKYELEILPSEITSDTSNVLYNAEDRKIRINNIPKNTDVQVKITANDGHGKPDVIAYGYQKWGYGIHYGALNSVEILNIEDNIDKLSSYVILQNDEINNEIEIIQDEMLYGVFICPENINIKFLDIQSNLFGGWHPRKLIKLYKGERETNYIVYMTDNFGIGRVNWSIQLDNE